MTSATINNWTQDRVEKLETLWQDGLSASMIASRLGDVTRNAVIGKVHRLGLARRAMTKEERRAARLTRPKINLPVSPTRTSYQPKIAPKKQAETQAVIIQKVMVRLASKPDIPEALRIELLDLQEKSCRWPVNDLARCSNERFQFCGHERAAGSSYCVHHAIIALGRAA